MDCPSGWSGWRVTFFPASEELRGGVLVANLFVHHFDGAGLEKIRRVGAAVLPWCACASRGGRGWRTRWGG